MIVAELVAWLQQQPQDAIVIYDRYSDFADMELDQVSLYTGQWEVNIFDQYDANRKPVYKTQKLGLIRHHGHLMVANEDWLTKQQLTSVEYLTAIHFPGN